jgi:hypothetical protein
VALLHNYEKATQNQLFTFFAQNPKLRVLPNE